MPDSRSARIIPFPTAATASARDRDRLADALELLQAALAEQKQAMAKWRRSLAELHDAVTILGGNLIAYRDELEKLQDGVARLNAEARRTERWAESIEDPASA